MYQATIHEIRETMPFEIRMNMFLIKCGDINNTLCDECEELIDNILSKAGDHVFQKMALDIHQRVKNISEDLNPKNGTSKQLVQSEKRLDDVKNIEKKTLEDSYRDLIEWFEMLSTNPRYRMTEENFKSV